MPIKPLTMEEIEAFLADDFGDSSRRDRGEFSHLFDDWDRRVEGRNPRSPHEERYHRAEQSRLARERQMTIDAWLIFMSLAVAAAVLDQSKYPKELIAKMRARMEELGKLYDPTNPNKRG